MAMVANSHCQFNPCAKMDVIDFLCRKYELPEMATNDRIGRLGLTGTMPLIEDIRAPIRQLRHSDAPHLSAGLMSGIAFPCRMFLQVRAWH